MLRKFARFGFGTTCVCVSRSPALRDFHSTLCACAEISKTLTPTRMKQFRSRPSEAVIFKPSYRFLHQEIVSLQKMGLSTSAAKSVTAASTDDTDYLGSPLKKNKLVTADAEKTLHRLYETYPQLQEYDHGIIIQYLEAMVAQTISVDNAIEMLLKYPSLLQTYKEKIPLTLSTLRGVGLNEKQRKTLIYEHPGLSDLTRSHITKRIAFLKSWFSDAETLELILQSVETLTDHDSILKRKLNYLIKLVCHETKYIVKSTVLSHSIQRIQCRHEFLIRCGLFKTVHYNKMIKLLEKTKSDKNRREKYFTPYQIVCLGDKEFLKVCTKNSLTSNELAAFEELYAVNVEDPVDQQEEDELSSDEEDNYKNDNESEPRETVNSGGFAGKAEGDQFYF